MSITRGELRTMALQQADAVGSSRWDATAGGEVDRRLSRAADKLWGRILSAAPSVRQSIRTPQADSQGRFLVTALSDTSSADAQERFFRVHAFWLDGAEYLFAQDGHKLVRAWQQSAGTTSGSRVLGGERLWWRMGTYIYTLPPVANALADAVVVSHRPTLVDQLSGDGKTVEFPDGAELILATWGAAELLMKGGAETEASIALRASVQEDLDELLQDLSRPSGDPQSVRFGDDPSDWAG